MPRGGEAVDEDILDDAAGAQLLADHAARRRRLRTSIITPEGGGSSQTRSQTDGVMFNRWMLSAADQWAVSSGISLTCVS